MLSSQKIEYRILQILMGSGESSWKATTLSALAGKAGKDLNAVVKALDHLFQKRVVELRKSADAHSFVPYRGLSIDPEFFHNGDLQMRSTSAGRPYLEMLHRQKELNRPEVREALHLATAAEKFLGLIQPHFMNSMKPPLMGIQLEGALQLGTQLRNVAKQIGLQRESVFGQQFSEMQRSVTAQFEPIMQNYRDISRQFAEEFGQQKRLLRDSPLHHGLEEMLTRIREQSQVLQEVTANFAPRLECGWPRDLLVGRVGLIEHTLKNVDAWHQMQEQLLANPPAASLNVRMEGLSVAGQFVYDYSALVRRLPPPICDEGNGDVEKEFRHRDEELGAKLEIELARINPELASLRRCAWEILAKGDAAAARLAAHGIREIFGEVLRRLAPDEEIKKTTEWESREDRTLNRPTRRMRLEYLVGQAASPLEALLQFDESLDKMHDFAHTFAENTEVVRVYAAQLETFTYLGLIHAKIRKN